MKNILWALAGIGVLLYGLDFLDQRGVLTSAAGEHRLDNSEISQVMVGSRVTYDLDRLRIFLGGDGKDASAATGLDSSLPDQEFLSDGALLSLIEAPGSGHSKESSTRSQTISCRPILRGRFQDSQTSWDRFSESLRKRPLASIVSSMPITFTS